MPAFLLDLDGVLYRGDRAVPGAAEFLDAIRDYPHAFLTNNSALPGRAFLDRLRRLDLPVAAHARILTSADATARVLAAERPGFRYFAVGGAGLHEALAGAGVPADDAVDYVVIGEGAGLDYEALRIGGNRVREGAGLIATNPDPNLDADDGALLPGGGALAAPFEVMTGRTARVIGKPAAGMFRIALELLGVERAIMVGDRPDTDIAGAARLGLPTLLVRTGRFAPDAPYPTDLPRPTWDVTDLRDWLAVTRLAEL